MQFLMFLSLLISMLTSSLDVTGQLLKISPKPIRCYGEDNGSLQISFDSIISVSYTLSIKDSTDKLIREFYSENPQSFLIDHLRAGAYTIDLKTRENIIKESRVAIIESPLEFKTNTISIFSIEGEIKPVYALKANPTGGSLPYSFEWSNNTGNQKGEIATQLSEGTYTCIVQDKNGCGPKTATFFLYKPEIEKYKQKFRSNE